MSLEWKDVYKENDRTPYKGEHYRVAGSYVCDVCDNLRCTLIQEFGDDGSGAFPLPDIYGHHIRMPCPFENRATFDFERSPDEDDPSWKDSGLPSYRERLDVEEERTRKAMEAWHEKNAPWESGFIRTRTEMRDGRPVLVMTMGDGIERVIGEGSAYVLEYELKDRLEEFKAMRRKMRDGEHIDDGI